MQNYVERLDALIALKEEEAEDKRNELLRYESFIWGLEMAKAMYKGLERLEKIEANKNE